MSFLNELFAQSFFKKEEPKHFFFLDNSYFTKGKEMKEVKEEVMDEEKPKKKHNKKEKKAETPKKMEKKKCSGCATGCSECPKKMEEMTVVEEIKKKKRSKKAKTEPTEGMPEIYVEAKAEISAPEMEMKDEMKVEPKKMGSKKTPGKGTAEAKAWGEQMKALREAKKKARESRTDS
jgi:hypothetical protein